MLGKVHLKHFFPSWFANQGPGENESSEECDELPLFLKHRLGKRLGLHRSTPVPFREFSINNWKVPYPDMFIVRINLTFRETFRIYCFPFHSVFLFPRRQAYDLIMNPNYLCFHRRRSLSLIPGNLMEGCSLVSFTLGHTRTELNQLTRQQSLLRLALWLAVTTLLSVFFFPPIRGRLR